ncbi:histidine kinase [beta proteobacterium AAP121]|nr:histidine kinase [beta proteobacterium AAP65]KPF99060.1 histidine kinase [beta proteobacterium AAP121]
MRLRTYSRGFFAAVLLALAANMAFLLAIRQAEHAVHVAIDDRDRAVGMIDELMHQNDKLAQLVQSFTTTAETRHLTAYYEVLAARNGEPASPTPAPGEAQPDASPPAPEGLIQRMQALGFKREELSLANELLAAAARMQDIEKVAFAATQGLYDVARAEFVSDGEPDRAYATALVHAPAYEQHRAALGQAVQRLAKKTDARTDGEVEQMRARLARAIGAGIVVNLALVPLLLGALGLLRRRVLQPINTLEASARRFGAGDFSAPATLAKHRSVQELDVLARVLDEMAGAIRSDLARRDADRLELQAARDAAEAATEAKSRFLANMSHEIRTPMNAIMGMTHLTLQTELTTEQRSFLEKSQGASRMLLALINDVLDFSKIEAGQMRVEAAPLAIETVVAQAIELVRQPAQARELELLCDFADASLLANRGTLRGDALRLQQVLTNLLSNAVKFTHAGQVRLVVDTDRSDHSTTHVSLVLTVQDTGIGMSEAALKSLFLEFAQADVSTTRRYGGTGLGLAISRRLVELMGGRIEVRSQLGAGSSFQVHLRLPLDPASATTAALACAPGARVLVVEDQRDTRLAILGQLHTLGIGSQGRLAGARDAAQTFAVLAEAAADGVPFDHVLLDWVLPDGEGSAVLKRLRQDHPALRVTVVSAYGSEDIRARALKQGVRDFISKPVLPEDLRSLFRGAAGASTAASEASTRLDGLRVLLVEDNALNQELAVELLRRRGARVEVAGNGLEAIERLAARGAGAFDAVLMDLQMPVLDGIEATRRLRANPEFDRLPVFAMTAHALAEERQRCLAAGMQGHIAKPLDMAVLVATLAPLAPAVGAAATAPRAALPPAPAAVKAPAASPAPRVAPRPLPPMPALDVASALRRFDGNESLYRNTLRGFAQEQGEGIAAWSAWAAEGRWSELRRAAHTLHGLARTIGADALGAGAQALEVAAAAADEPAVHAGVPGVAQQLAEVVAQIEAALDPLPAWMSTESPPLAEETGVDTAATLRTLRELLQASDSQALELWQAQHAALRRALPMRNARQLSQAMRVLDFDAALAALPEEPT